MYKWSSPYEWLCDAVNDNDVTVTELLQLIVKNVDNDAIQDMFQSSMDNDGYFDEINENPVYCACGSETCSCPECGQEYYHGKYSRCPNCKDVNAPLDCSGCGFVVSDNLDGILDYDMNLIECE